MAQKKRSTGEALTRAANAVLEAAAERVRRFSDEELETIEGYLPAAYLYVREETLPYEDWAAGDHSRAFTYAWVIMVMVAAEELRRRRSSVG